MELRVHEILISLTRSIEMLHENCWVEDADAGMIITAGEVMFGATMTDMLPMARKGILLLKTWSSFFFFLWPKNYQNQAIFGLDLEREIAKKKTIIMFHTLVSQAGPENPFPQTQLPPLHTPLPLHLPSPGHCG